jgi:hypothetical protein
MVSKLLSSVVERLSESFIGYFQLWKYFDQRLQRALSGSAIHNIASCQEFYNRVRREEIRHGDWIRLKDFFVTEWVPRAAGAVFEDQEFLQEDLPTLFPVDYGDIKSNPELDREAVPTSGVLYVRPYGSVRFPLGGQEDFILGAVSPAEYYVDMGIPLVVGRSVYNEFQRKQIVGCSVEASLEGVVEVFGSVTLPSYRSLSNSELETPRLFEKPTLPSTPWIIVRVVSPLQARFRSHNSHPLVAHWSINRLDLDEEKFYYYHYFFTSRVDNDSLHWIRKMLGAETSIPSSDQWVSPTKLFEYDARQRPDETIFRPLTLPPRDFGPILDYLRNILKQEKK